MFHTPAHKNTAAPAGQIASAPFSSNRAKHQPDYDANGCYNHRRCDVIVAFLYADHNYQPDWPYALVCNAVVGDCLDAIEWLPSGSLRRTLATVNDDKHYFAASSVRSF